MTRKTRATGLELATTALLGATALLVLGSAQIAAADHHASLSLQYSQNPDRSDAQPLDESAILQEGAVSIFLSPSNVKDVLKIRNVEFYVNGELVRTEYAPPYDLGGTISGRSGYRSLYRFRSGTRGTQSGPVHTDSFELGPNSVTAVIHYRDFGDDDRASKGSDEVAADFAVLPPGDTIVDVAAGNPDFSILVEAVVAAGLADELSEPGTYTVFAPTNQAFIDALGILGISKEELLEDKERLTKILTYHVLNTIEFSGDVLASDQLIPIEGEPIEVNAEELKVNDSTLIAVDILASNGVIHVIDAVLIPPSGLDPQPTIAEIAAGNPDFSILVEAVVEAGLGGLLSVTGPELTVFAPTNEAFVELLDALGATKEDLLGNRDLLVSVLLYHIVNEELFAADVLSEEEIFPMESEPIAVDAENGKLNGATIIGTDVDASNGVIHVIDGVLVPPAALKILAE